MCSVANKMDPMKRRAAGFTLVELMTVIFIMAVLAFVVVPSFQDTIGRNAVEGQQLELMTALSQARQEAITRNLKVSICRSIDGTNCAGVGDWGSGWIIFKNMGTAGTVAAGADVLAKHGPLKQGVTVRLLDSGDTARAFMQFDPSGFVASTSAASSGTFVLCPSDKTVNRARAVLVNAVGRGVQSRANSSGIHMNISDVALTCP
jgi:type IV fimbrial biogenesis protein FimT